ncbi:hypothetical protein B1Q39_002306 [Salmonella enterica]|nr:hypothetical protein [Salmonella enterica]
MNVMTPSVPDPTTFGEVRQRAWKIMPREALKSTAQRMSERKAGGDEACQIRTELIQLCRRAVFSCGCCIFTLAEF